MKELEAYARKQKYEPPDTSRVYNYDQLMSNHKNDRTRVNEHLLKRYTDTVALMTSLDEGVDHALVAQQFSELKRQHVKTSFGLQGIAARETDGFVAAFDRAYQYK